MNRLVNHIILLCFGVMSISCIDQINLDLPTGETNLVVFGWVTNKPEAYEISISLSNGYSDQSGYPAVSGAEVYVTDNSNARYDFTEVGETGKYLSDPAEFTGVPGETYRLTIITEDATYTSTAETMPVVTNIEDPFINFIADPNEFQIEPTDENFFISAFVIDDPGVDNYYRWKVYVNGQLRNQPEDLVLFDDKFTNGNKFRYDAGNVAFTLRDTPFFEHMSMTEGAYDFYLNLRDQTSNSTLSPRIQPGIIEGNISNVDDPDELVLGYFGASEVRLIAVD